MCQSGGAGGGGPWTLQELSSVDVAEDRGWEHVCAPAGQKQSLLLCGWALRKMFLVPRVKKPSFSLLESRSSLGIAWL